MLQLPAEEKGKLIKIEVGAVKTPRLTLDRKVALTVKINSVRLENFKGIENLVINASGANVIIRGENGTGKSTVSDAYFWTLTGKFTDGSLGEVNRYDADGKLIRDEKVHAVEIELDDSTTIRRESINVFDKNGNFKSTTQNFYIDGVELKQKEFESEVAKITCGVSINPFSFCQMNWKERRNILMKMSPIDEVAVRASDESFKQLNLGKYAADTFISVQKAEIKKLNTELQGIPARIDELSRKKFSVEGDEESLRAEISKLKAELQEAAAKVETVQKSMSGNEKLKSEMLKVQRKVYALESEIERTKINIEHAEDRLKELREEFKKMYVMSAGKCPTCGQKIPAEEFQAQKESKLEEIKVRGTAHKEVRDKLTSDLAKKVEELEQLKWQLEEMQAQVEDGEKTAGMEELKTAGMERDKIISELTEAQNKLARFLQNQDETAKTQSRIEYLKKRERELNQQIADCEGQINLAEKFIRAKIKLTEDTINAKFEFVKFKMFETLLNGSIKEICEPMIEGVPYNSGLNRGAKLKAALDILKTLQKYYGVELPIFIDDAESYTSNSLVKLPNQMFRMVAAEGVRKLKIEVEKPARVSKPVREVALKFEEVEVA